MRGGGLKEAMQAVHMDKLPHPAQERPTIGTSGFGRFMVMVVEYIQPDSSQDGILNTVSGTPIELQGGHPRAIRDAQDGGQVSSGFRQGVQVSLCPGYGGLRQTTRSP